MENEEQGGLLSKLKSMRDSANDVAEKISNSKTGRAAKSTKNVLSYLFTDKGYNEHAEDYHKTLKDSAKKLVLSEHQIQKRDFEENLKQSIDILLKDLKGEEADKIREQIMKKTVSSIMKRDKEELKKIMSDNVLMTAEFTASLDTAMKPFEKILGPDQFSDTLDNALKRAFFGDVEQKKRKEDKEKFDEVSDKIDDIPNTEEFALSVDKTVKATESKLSDRIDDLDNKFTKILVKPDRPDLNFDNNMANRGLGANKAGLFKRFKSGLKTNQDVKEPGGFGLGDLLGVGGAGLGLGWLIKKFKDMMGMGKNPKVNLPKVKPGSWSATNPNARPASPLKPVTPNVKPGSWSTTKPLNHLSKLKAFSPSSLLLSPTELGAGSDKLPKPGTYKTPWANNVAPKVNPLAPPKVVSTAPVTTSVAPKVNPLAPPKSFAPKVPVKGPSMLSKGLGTAGKIAGKVAVPLTGAIAGYDRYTQVKDDKTLSTAQKTTKVGMTAGGAMAGAASGAMAGAAIGSVVPVFGTAIGGIVGGIAGAYLGQKGGDAVGDYASSKMQTPKATLKAPAGYKPQATVPGIKTGPTPAGMLPPPPLLVKQIDRVEAAANKLEGIDGNTTTNNNSVIKKPVTVDQRITKIEKNTTNVAKNVNHLTRTIIKEKQKDPVTFKGSESSKTSKKIATPANVQSDESGEDQGFFGTLSSAFSVGGFTNAAKAGGQYISNKAGAATSGGGFFGGGNNSGGGPASKGSFFSKAWQAASNAATNVGNTVKGKGFKLNGGANYQGINPGVKKNFEAMASEYKQKTGKDILITSGYRSSEEQARLYATKPKGMAAKPGRSMHEFGMAMDINSPNANELANMGLLSKYGFDRPYLYTKGETWHIEPIGLNKDAIRAAGPSARNAQVAQATPGQSNTKPTASKMATEGVDKKTLEVDKKDKANTTTLAKKTNTSAPAPAKTANVSVKSSTTAPVTVARNGDSLDSTKDKKQAPVVINNTNSTTESKGPAGKPEFGIRHVATANPYATSMMML